MSNRSAERPCLRTCMLSAVGCDGKSPLGNRLDAGEPPLFDLRRRKTETLELRDPALADLRDPARLRETLFERAPVLGEVMRETRAGVFLLFDELCHVLDMLRRDSVAPRYINCGSASIQP